MEYSFDNHTLFLADSICPILPFGIVANALTLSFGQPFSK